MKKLLYLLSLLIIASMVLAACGGAATEAPAAEEPAAEEPAAEEPAAEEPAASEKVQIRWFVGLGTGTDPGQVTIQEEVVADFNASQDKIELVLEVVPYDSARDTLSTQIASGAGPDIVGPVGWGGSNDFYGQWLDIAPYIEQSGFDLSVFDPALVKFYQTEEGQVGLPQVHRLGQGEGQIKPAQRVERGGAFGYFVAARVVDLIGHRLSRARDGQDIGPLAQVQLAHPALEVHFFAGAVHSAVVDHVPAHLIRAKALLPAAAPPAHILGQDYTVLTYTGDQVARLVGAAGWHVKGRQTVAARLGGGLAGIDRDPGSGHRRPILQGAGPHDQLFAVDKGVYA